MKLDKELINKDKKFTGKLFLSEIDFHEVFWGKKNSKLRGCNQLFLRFTLVVIFIAWAIGLIAFLYFK